MNVTECYRVLGLRSGASFEDIKSSYRRLARQCHPDVSAGDHRANDKFIELTTAYKFLLNALTDSGPGKRTGIDPSRRSPAPGSRSSSSPQPFSASASTASTTSTSTASTTSTSTASTTPVSINRIRVSNTSVNIQMNPAFSRQENDLKVSTYQQLRQLLRDQRFPRAIALVEGLARRLPQDSEVIQWQAIVYQKRARQLIRDQQPDKARLYLRKALRTDPHNRSLWAEVEKDFRNLEQLF